MIQNFHGEFNTHTEELERRTQSLRGAYGNSHGHWGTVALSGSLQEHVSCRGLAAH